MLQQRVRGAAIAVGVVVGTLLFAGALAAQPPAWDSPPPGRTSAVLRLPGKTVEVIGLRRWTLAMVQDSMAKYAPGESLASHACAAVLRYKLGFADAATTTFVGFQRGDSTERIVVSVVEPQDSARVRYRRVPFDTTKPYAPWADGIALVRQHPMAAQRAYWLYQRWRRDPAATSIEPATAGDSASVRQYLRFLTAHASAADEATAIRLLATSPDYSTRVVAASVLQSFLEHDDRAVFALLDALVTDDGMAKSAAGAGLTMFSSVSARPVPWTAGGKAPVVHALLDGTGLFELPNAISVLVSTGASPADAKAFLGNGGGRMLLAYLGAVTPPYRESAHRLLVALKGGDLGLDPAPWQAWIATL